MTIISRLYSIVLLVLLSSCISHQNKTKGDTLLIDSDGWFRGYLLGQNAEDILEKESWQPVVSNDSIAEFRQSIIYKDDSLELDLYLSFDQLGLFEIQVDFWIENQTLSKGMLAEFDHKLSLAFGEFRLSGEEKMWTTNSETNSIIEITLAEEESAKEKKFLSLNYLEPLNDKY